MEIILAAAIFIFILMCWDIVIVAAILLFVALLFVATTTKQLYKDFKAFLKWKYNGRG